MGNAPGSGAEGPAPRGALPKKTGDKTFDLTYSGEEAIGKLDASILKGDVLFTRAP